MDTNTENKTLREIQARYTGTASDRFATYEVRADDLAWLINEVELRTRGDLVSSAAVPLDAVSREAVNQILYKGSQQHMHDCTNSVRAVQFVHGLMREIAALLSIAPPAPSDAPPHVNTDLFERLADYVFEKCNHNDRDRGDDLCRHCVSAFLTPTNSPGEQCPHGIAWSMECLSCGPSDFEAVSTPSDAAVNEAVRDVLRLIHHRYVLTFRKEEIKGHCPVCYPWGHFTKEPATLREDIAAIITKHLQATPSVPSEWQHIETAPKDETEIILARFGHVSIVPVNWIASSYWLPRCIGSPLQEDPNGKCVCCPEDRAYTGKWKGWEFVCAQPPTHWMPLRVPHDSVPSTEAGEPK